MILPPIGDLIADVCVLGGALALASGSILRVSRVEYRRALTLSLRQAMLWGVAELLSMSDGAQVLIDRISGVPNLGMLVRLVLLLVGSYRTLVLLDDLVGIRGWRRRWHHGFMVAATVITIVCWEMGVPHNVSLPTITVAVPLDGANRWLYAIAWLYPLEVMVQYGGMVRISLMILLHTYAVGYDRATYTQALLFVIAQCLFVLDGVGLLLYPPGQATGHLNWIDLSTHTTEGFGTLGVLLCVAAYCTPLWVDRLQLRTLDTLLRLCLLLSSYRAVRHLALHLQTLVPPADGLCLPRDIGLSHIRTVTQLDLCMQLCKTAINDVRLKILPYLGPDDGSKDGDVPSPEQAAQEFITALRGFSQNRSPSKAPTTTNALRNAHLFNDERFLASLWHAYKATSSRHITPGREHLAGDSN